MRHISEATVGDLVRWIAPDGGEDMHPRRGVDYKVLNVRRPHGDLDLAEAQLGTMDGQPIPVHDEKFSWWALTPTHLRLVDRGPK